MVHLLIQRMILSDRLEYFWLKRKDMKKYDIIPIIFWIGLSIFMMVLSIRLGLGKFHNPGPGFMPFLLGLLLILISFYLFLNCIVKKEDGDKRMKDKQNQINFIKIGLVSASLFVYALVLNRLGYLIATFLLLTVLFRSVGLKRWSSLLIISALTVLVTYFVFTSLGLRFPEGILKLR